MDETTRRYSADNWAQLKALMASVAFEIDVTTLPHGEPATTLLDEDDVLAGSEET